VIFNDLKSMFETCQPANIGNIAFSLQANMPDPTFPEVQKNFRHPVPYQAIELKRTVNIIQCQPCAQCDALRCDDVTQLAPFRSPHLNISLRNQAFDVPVDGTDSYTQLRGKGSLCRIRVLFDAFEDIEIVLLIVCCGHRFNIQWLNYNSGRPQVKGQISLVAVDARKHRLCYLKIMHGDKKALLCPSMSDRAGLKPLGEFNALLTGDLLEID